MKKKAAIAVNCIAIFLAFAFMFCFCVFFPRTEESDNSTLKEFPTFSFATLMNGDFFSDFSAWFTDTVCLRDRFVDINAKFRDYFGITPHEQVIIRDESDTDVSEDEPWTPGVSESDSSSDMSEISKAPETSDTSQPDDSSADTSSTPPNESSETSISEISQAEKPVEVVNDVLIIGTRAMEIYYGSEENAKAFAAILNKFAAKIDEDVNVYSMVVPKACAFYISESKKYSKYAGRSLRDINTLSGALSSAVTDVPIYSILESHKDEEIYYRTDHHWTGLGAYYAAEKFAQTAGVDFTPLSSYTKKVRTGYVGTMYKYTNYSATLLNNPEDFVTYAPTSSYVATFYDQKLQNGRTHDLFWYVDDDHRSSWYSTYLAGDAYSVVIKSGTCTNGRKLLIVKDSYGNALVPYFVDSFEEIYVVDARVFSLSLTSLVSEKDITDVLFAECAYSAVGAYRKNVEALTE